MAASSLSDGELQESSEEDNNPSNKRTKLSEDELPTDPNDEWTLVTTGPRKRKGSLETVGNKKTKKRKRRNRTVTYEDDALGQTAPPLPTSEREKQYLSSLQSQLLHVLTSAAEGHPGPKKPSNYKTADFQAALRFLLVGKPGLGDKGKKKKKYETIQNKKILVVWLSTVSRDNFDAFGNFSRIKSFSPQFQFILTHPGSDRYVQFGLEAFMNVDDSSKHAPRKPNGTFPSPEEEFSRRHCLLTHDDLVQNEYPLPPDDPASLPDDYIVLGAWMGGSLAEAEMSGYPMFAVDCEMIQTEIGSELARVSIINEDLECVYTTFVKPSHKVVDYLTRYSGVDESMLADVSVTLSDVQAKLKEILPAKSILIGHSLENDLFALKLYHPHVIDTALLFTPNATPRSKPSLKTLVRKLLGREIQVDQSGHDPTEDATSCMELVKKKLAEGEKCVISWNDTKTWLPSVMSIDVTTTIVDKQSLVSLYTSQSRAEPCVVASDEEAVAKAIESLSASRFVFVQFHSLENYLKNRDTANKEDDVLSILSSLDQWSYQLIQSAPPGTIAFVVCGSNNLKEVRRLQKDLTTDSQTLKEAVMKAREGYVLTVFK